MFLAYFLIPDFRNFLQEAWLILGSGDEERIKEWVSRFGWVGPAVIILGMTFQMFLMVIPSLALMIVSVLAYGPWLGSLIILTAIFSASSIGYLIGTYFGTLVIKKLIGDKTEQKMENFIEDYGFWAVVIVRLNPMLSNDAISFVAGILNMGYWRFIGASLLGIAPLTAFIAVMGESTERMKTGFIWLSVVSVLLFLLYLWWDKKLRKK